MDGGSRLVQAKRRKWNNGRSGREVDLLTEWIASWWTGRRPHLKIQAEEHNVSWNYKDSALIGH